MIGVWGPAQMLEETSRTRRSAAVEDDDGATVGAAVGATIGYMDAVARILFDGGFSTDLAHHTMHVLGSRVLGFSQDLFDDGAEVDPAVASAAARQLATLYPSVGAIAMAASHEGGLGGCDDDVEFTFGLDIILDGLERERARQAGPPDGRKDRGEWRQW